MTFEIERRFLCRILDQHVLDTAPSWLITQGYISNTGPTVRIRRLGGEFVLTIKSGGGLVRREIEFAVPTGPGTELLELAGDRSVEKTRYRLSRWEVDIFHGKLAGLVLAEVELSSSDEETPPPPPGVELVQEVTLDPLFTNHNLALLDPPSARRFVERTKEMVRG